MTRYLRTLSIALAVLVATILFGHSATAQLGPTLNFKRIVNNWPTIELYFTVACNGNPAYDMQKQNFKVVENPDCPPPYIDCLPYLPASDFFSDVWSSRDGVNWTQLTADAGFGSFATHDLNDAANLYYEVRV